MKGIGKGTKIPSRTNMTFQMKKKTNIYIFGLAVIQSMLISCAATGRSSGVITGREATAIWHTYEILPDYHYYYAGPDAQPFYIIGIDDRYKLMSKLWNAAPTTLLLSWLLDNRQILKYDGAFSIGKGG